MKSTAIIVIGVWMFLIVGWIVNLVDVIVTVAGVSSIGEITPFTLFQIISIFLGPIGSIVGYVSLFV